MKVAVVGATGLVGTKMLEVLAERNFPVTELIPVASEKSVGKKVRFKKRNGLLSAQQMPSWQNRLSPFFLQAAVLLLNGRQNLRQPELR